MNNIITRGLGPKQRLILQGYGKKWRKAKVPTIWKLEICPCCEIPIRNNLYYTRDVFTREKIFRCKHCNCILKYENGHWQKVPQWYEDSW